MTVSTLNQGAQSSRYIAVEGPIGAGKTSLLNCINMHYRPQRGSITFDGRELNGLRPHAVATWGIARTFQKVELFHGMSVLDNIKLGRHFLMKSSLLGSFLRLPNIVRDEMKHREEIEEPVHELRPVFAIEGAHLHPGQALGAEDE